MKIIILKIIKQVVFRFSEHTPPSIKHSARNELVATIAFRIDQLILMLKNKTNDKG